MVRLGGPRREMSRLQLFANSCERIFNIISTGTAAPGPAGWFLVGSAETVLGRKENGPQLQSSSVEAAALTVGSPGARAPQVFPGGWSGCWPQVPGAARLLFTRGGEGNGGERRIAVRNQVCGNTVLSLTAGCVPSCVTLGQLLDPSEPWFPHLKHGANNICLTGHP